MTNDQLFQFGNEIKPTQKLVQFDNMKRTGTIELRPIHSDVTKDGYYKKRIEVHFRCYRDPNTDIWYGIPIGYNRDGTYKFKPIHILGHKFFNLANEQDAKEWHIELE